MTGLSRSFLYLRIADGQLKTALIGRRRVVLLASLEEMIAASVDQKAAA